MKCLKVTLLAVVLWGSLPLGAASADEGYGYRPSPLSSELASLARVELPALPHDQTPTGYQPTQLSDNFGTLPPVTHHVTLPAIPRTVQADGLDTSMRISAWGYRDIRDKGYSFVGRYLEISPSTAGEWGGKVYYLTASELANARTAGVGVFLIFEWCTGRLHPPTTYSNGVRDAQIALAALERLGLPADTPVYYSLDSAPNASAAQVCAYFQGVRSLMPWRAVGCYGSDAQLTALYEAGLVRYRWHARWMDGNPAYSESMRHTMYQSTALRYVGGVWCDQNWAFTTALGGVR